MTCCQYFYIFATIALFFQTIFIILMHNVSFSKPYSNSAVNNLMLDGDCIHGCTQCVATNITKYNTIISDTNISYILYDIQIINSKTEYLGTACVTNLFSYSDWNNSMYIRINMLYGMAWWLCNPCNDLSCDNYDFYRCFTTRDVTHEYNGKQLHDVFLDIIPTVGTYNYIAFFCIFIVASIFFTLIMLWALYLKYLRTERITNIIFRHYYVHYNIITFSYVLVHILGIIYTCCLAIFLHSNLALDSFTEKHNILLITVLHLLILHIFVYLLVMLYVIISFEYKYTFALIPIIGLYYFCKLKEKDGWKPMYISHALSTILSVISVVPTDILMIIYHFETQRDGAVIDIFIFILLKACSILHIMCMAAFFEMHTQIDRLII